MTTPSRDRSEPAAFDLRGDPAGWALAVALLIPPAVLVHGLVSGSGQVALTSVPLLVCVLCAARALVKRTEAQRLARPGRPRGRVRAAYALAVCWTVVSVLAALLAVGVLFLPS